MAASASSACSSGSALAKSALKRRLGEENQRIWLRRSGGMSLAYGVSAGEAAAAKTRRRRDRGASAKGGFALAAARQLGENKRRMSQRSASALVSTLSRAKHQAA